MLTTSDIGDLFQAMRTAYGVQWKHGADAIPVWRKALNELSPRDLQAAANKVIQQYRDHPPTLPQVLDIAIPKRRASTYLPPPEISPQASTANRYLVRELMACGGVDAVQLRNMVETKNTIAGEWDEDPDMAFIAALQKEIEPLIKNHSKSEAAKERERSVEAYRVRQGMR